MRINKKKAADLAQLLDNHHSFYQSVFKQMGWDRWSIHRRKKGLGWTTMEREKYLGLVKERLGLLELQIKVMESEP